MKQFIEIPQGEEIVLINVNHISAIETVTFGENNYVKFMYLLPINGMVGLLRLDA